mmetsp:Transcript_942/g.2349  ORF Transcript_942/g.2349 Transcript_942/m.2349 type:complete len:205 (-) Transcript_942:1310-1924(-)
MATCWNGGPRAFRTCQPRCLGGPGDVPRCVAPSLVPRTMRGLGKVAGLRPPLERRVREPLGGAQCQAPLGRLSLGAHGLVVRAGERCATRGFVARWLFWRGEGSHRPAQGAARWRRRGAASTRGRGRKPPQGAFARGGTELERLLGTMVPASRRVPPRVAVRACLPQAPHGAFASGDRWPRQCGHCNRQLRYIGQLVVVASLSR